jgi:hypothetical protein
MPKWTLLVRIRKVLGYPIAWYLRMMGDHKTVRYMNETERQILAKLCGKEDAREAEVTGLEYWDEAGNVATWKTCSDPVSHCCFSFGPWRAFPTLV